jgi:hypothetical protein
MRRHDAEGGMPFFFVPTDTKNRFWSHGFAQVPNLLEDA